MNALYRRIPYLLIIAALLVVVFNGCERDEEPEPEEEQDNLTPEITWQIMNAFYLWYQTMPAINPENYDTPQEVLEKLRNTTYDRFSYMESTEEFLAYYQQGVYIGHGFSLKYDEQGDLRVAFVYDEAPADLAGVERGWIIESINGTYIEPFSNYFDLLGDDEAGVQNTFQFTDNSGNQVNLTIDKQEVDIKSILHQEVFDVNGTKVGYMVFNHFIEPALAELEEAFTSLQDSGVEEFVLDLRYNRGGLETVYTYLAGLVGGEHVNGQVFTKYIHNDKQSTRNKIVFAESYDISLDIDRISFITTGSTASASELVINGLKPYMEVKSFGEDTYGKPVGMYAWQYDDYTLVPICFKYTNANDEGDFYDGLEPDVYIPDDLTVPFGDPEEDCLKAALEYIRTGELPEEAAVKADQIKMPVYEPPGLKFEIGAI
jgi:carboxyl-terminal processing protease